MAVVEIVSSAVALLSPYLVKAAEGAAQEAGKNSWEKVKGIYQAIRHKFANDKDEYAQQTLKRLEEKPVEKRRQEALESILEEKVEADSGFAAQLAELVKDTTQGQPVSQFVTQVFGDGRVGKIANFVNVDGDVTL